jgi:hypothetical protein
MSKQVRRGQARGRRRVVQAILLSLCALGVLYGLVVMPLWAEYDHAGEDLTAALEAIEESKKTAIQAKTAYDDMVTWSNRLAQAESTMAGGDVYSWVVKTFEALRAGHGVQFTQIDSPDVKDSQTLPKVEYKEARFGVSGRATYHSLGAFIAQLENSLPFARLLDLEMHAPGASRGDFEESEQLRFKMQVSVLMKPEAGTEQP